MKIPIKSIPRASKYTYLIILVFGSMFSSLVAYAENIEDAPSRLEEVRATTNLEKLGEPNEKLKQESQFARQDAMTEFLKFANKLEQVDKDIQFLKHTSTEDKQDWITPIFSIIGVILGVIAGGFFSYRLQISQRNFEICKSLMDWKVNQLSELYGPLHALLHQSSALYRHMNNVLIKLDATKFRLDNDPTNGDFDTKKFQIFENDEWKDFRTVTHINLVYGHNFKIEQYFDEIIGVGERMVKIIEEKAGYVREDQTELAEVFGQYLAHYAVLRKIHNDNKKIFDEQQNISHCHVIQKISVDESAAFPRKIQKLVQTGYRELNSELNNWGKQGNFKKNQ